jgi:predicted enzyme related to lactoylglutathione lyase
MAKITGIGGVFLKAKSDSAKLAAWYQQHLGMKLEPWGGAALRWPDDHADDKGVTAWHVASPDSNWFSPSKSSFMINYRVADLAALLDALRKEGCHVLDKTDDSEYGKFGWVMDPEGNKVELWQPPPGQ